MQKNRISRLAPGLKKAPQTNSQSNSGADFDSFVERSLVPVEQGTVFEFIRHIPHDWKAPRNKKATEIGTFLELFPK